MLAANKGKIAAILLISGVATLIFCRNTQQEPVLPNAIAFVCVESGKIFRLPRGQVFTVPRENPVTKKATLVPIHQTDGKWFVEERSRATVQRMGAQNKFVDPKSLAVKQPS